MPIDTSPSHPGPSHPGPSHSGVDLLASPDADRTPRRRSRTPRRRLVAAALAVVALTVALAACAPPGSPGSGATGDVVSAVNQDRSLSGLPGLAWDGNLANMAQNKANDIAARGALVHSDLGSMIAGWRSLGENLLVAPPGMNGWGAEDAWMNSPPHRANVLGGFTHVGVGVKVDGAGRTWFVALFGAR